MTANATFKNGRKEADYGKVHQACLGATFARITKPVVKTTNKFFNIRGRNEQENPVM